MYYFFIDAYAPTASFRLPESHTFQQTLPLPPVTALVGLAGAAMGLSFEQAIQLREEGLLCGVWGKHGGEGSDLWKYQKIKSDEVISAVLTREILFDLVLKIVYAHQNDKIIIKLREAFLSPVYALSAGTSDDIIKLRHVSEVFEIEKMTCYDIENAVLAGDHSRNYESAIKSENIPLRRSVRAPKVYWLPVSFAFNNDERRVKSRSHFTFIDTPVNLKEPVMAIAVEGKVLPLL